MGTCFSFRLNNPAAGFCPALGRCHLVGAGPGREWLGPPAHPPPRTAIGERGVRWWWCRGVGRVLLCGARPRVWAFFAPRSAGGWLYCQDGNRRGGQEVGNHANRIVSQKTLAHRSDHAHAQPLTAFRRRPARLEVRRLPRGCPEPIPLVAAEFRRCRHRWCVRHGSCRGIRRRMGRCGGFRCGWNHRCRA